MLLNTKMSQNLLREQNRPILSDFLLKKRFWKIKNSLSTGPRVAMARDISLEIW